MSRALLFLDTSMKKRNEEFNLHDQPDLIEGDPDDEPTEAIRILEQIDEKMSREEKKDPETRAREMAELAEEQGINDE